MSSNCNCSACCLAAQHTTDGVMTGFYEGEMPSFKLGQTPPYLFKWNSIIYHIYRISSFSQYHPVSIDILCKIYIYFFKLAAHNCEWFVFPLRDVTRVKLGFVLSQYSFGSPRPDIWCGILIASNSVLSNAKKKAPFHFVIFYLV